LPANAVGPRLRSGGGRAAESSAMDPALLAAAEAATGFMPRAEGEALHAAARAAAGSLPGLPLLEVGTYCGKSAIWLGAAARAADTVLFTVDHHRGSEENQAGWAHHDEALVDPELGVMDTLPRFRRTMHDAGLEDVVIAVVGRSATVARHWRAPLAFCFIDGGHGDDEAATDYRSWVGHVAPGGTLAIHDVFPDPADGGRPPYERIYRPALASGLFDETAAVGSLRLLRRR
jgi:predicted O-methyltransferase YrrM